MLLNVLKKSIDINDEYIENIKLLNCGSRRIFEALAKCARVPFSCLCYYILKNYNFLESLSKNFRNFHSRIPKPSLLKIRINEQYVEYGMSLKEKNYEYEEKWNLL